MLNSLAGWFVMLLLSVANGAIRDFTYGRHMDELTAHQISTGSSVVLLGIAIWGYVRIYPPSSSSQALWLGLRWMLLTVAFEFLFFHYVGGHSWTELLSNYNLLRGRVWVLVLAWVATAPYLFFRMRRRRECSDPN
jgi:hypothetical protein